MEETYPQSDPAVPVGALASSAVQVLWSIILPPFTEPAQLSAYLDRLKLQRHRPDYEILIPVDEGQMADLEGLPHIKRVQRAAGSTSDKCIDACVRAATGEYLLLLRQLVHIDTDRLKESMRELAMSDSELSISETGTFVLAKRSLYGRAGGRRLLFDAMGSLHGTSEPMAHQTVHHVRNLCNDLVRVACGPNTLIDAEVVIDSPECVRIGANCVIRKGVVLRPEGGEIVLGDNCVVNHYCVLHGKGGIYIGDWTIIAPHCGFYAQNHTFDSFDVPITKQPNLGRGIYLMGDNWIGAGAVICDDVTLGKGAVVGANSTVTRSIPMACVAVGSPARVIKKRYREDWDFCQRERAVAEGMPVATDQYVRERGRRIAALVDANDHVLDIGCGEGLITRLIANKCPQTVGCDYCEETVRAAVRRHPEVEFVYSNATSLRFPDESFTKVVLSEVAEHLLPMQFVRTLDEAHRVLKPGGKLILSTPLTGNAVHTSTYAHIYEYSEQEMSVLLGRVFGPARLQDGKFGILTAQKGW